MIVNFKYGFLVNGFTYGWNKKELYRLPSIKNGKSYPLKKLKIIKVGNQFGYLVQRKKLSIKQLQLITNIINKSINILEDKKDLPF